MRSFGVTNSSIRANLLEDVRYAVLGLKVVHSLSQTVKASLTNISLLGTTGNDAFAWELVFNPTIAGAPVFTAVGHTSESEWLDGQNITTGGTTVYTGVGYSRTPVVISRNIIVTKSDVFAVVIRPYSRMHVVAGMSWDEIIG